MDIIPANVASQAVIPAMPPALQTQVDMLRRGGTRFEARDGDAGLFVPAPPPAFHPEAPGALAAVDLLCQPATPELRAAWLRTLSLAIPRAPTAAALAVQSELIGTLWQDIPAGAWCRETMVEAVHTFKQWWPSIGELHALLKPHADRLTGTRDALRKIVAANAVPTPKPAESTRDGPAIAYVTEIVAAFEQERTWHNPDAPAGLTETARPKPRHLSDGALLATWEKLAADGVGGAHIRVAMLRQRIAAADAQRITEAEGKVVRFGSLKIW